MRLRGTETDSILIVKAKAKLIFTVTPTLYIHVKDADTCKEVWNTVKILYDDAGLTRKIGLLRTFVCFRRKL